MRCNLYVIVVYGAIKIIPSPKQPQISTFPLPEPHFSNDAVKVILFLADILSSKIKSNAGLLQMYGRSQVILAHL